MVFREDKMIGEQLILPLDSDVIRVEKSLESENNKAVQLFRLVDEFVIETVEDMDLAKGLLDQIKTTIAMIEDKRTSITKPINKSLKEINALFHGLALHYVESEKILKNKMAAVIAAKQQEQDEALKQVEVGAVDATTLAVAHGGNVIEAPKGISIGKIWRFLIKEDDLIPRELCSGDVSKIRAALNAGRTNIPGVEAWQEDSVRSRKSK
jgi:hypothetical protein